jgi:hypothetical protein
LQSIFLAQRIEMSADKSHQLLPAHSTSLSPHLQLSALSSVPSVFTHAGITSTTSVAIVGFGVVMHLDAPAFAWTLQKLAALQDSLNMSLPQMQASRCSSPSSVAQNGSSLHLSSTEFV